MTNKELKKIINEVVKEELLREKDWDKVPIPAQVKRFMAKFVAALKDAKLNRIKTISILLTVIKALGITPEELIKYMSKIKKGLKNAPQGDE